MNDAVIYEHERLDDLQRDGLFIIQDPKRFCFGIDAVLLSGFVHIKEKETILDLGTGTGAIPILLSARRLARHLTGIDIQKECVDMAARSVRLNSLEQMIDMIHLDIKGAQDYFPKTSFDVITVNPPYISKGGGLLNHYGPKAIARHEILCSLPDIVKTSASLLKTGGRMYMVHRPHRLVDIMTTLRLYELEPKKIRFVHTNVNKEPNLVLIEAISKGKSMLKICPPLFIYNTDGTYTDEVYDIYYGSPKD